MFRHDVMNIF